MKIKTKMVVALLAATNFVCTRLSAQNEMHGEISEVNIVGTRAPLSADKAVRLVQVLNRKDIEAASAQSINDLLKLVAGIDVRQRGANGVQTDIGINGGNCDQLTILLNGVNITNPHTGHLTVDLPVSPDDIERIEVIEGGASRVYGSNAFSGAINIITRHPVSSSIGINLQGGSFGSAGTNANLALTSAQSQHYIAAGYSRSDGGSANSDYRKMNGYWMGKATLTNIKLNAQLGMSRMDYGANTFYGTGSQSQYEEGRRYIASLAAETTGKIAIKPLIYWNRSIDHYVWTRSNPSAYENFHQTNVYGANLGAHTSWALGTSAIGLELRREEILSTRLGREISPESHKVPGHDTYYKYFDGRTNYSVYIEHNIALRNASISLGMIANNNTACEGGTEFYPGVDLSWTPAKGMRVYASFNKSLRMPTFTDLYYNGPGLQGNSSLKPEKSNDFAVGMSLRSHAISTQIKAFYRRGYDMIDWVKMNNAQVWTTANSDIDNMGVEALANIAFTEVWGNESWLQNATVSYCYIYQTRINKEQSAQYASPLNYLRNKFVTSISHRVAGKLSASWNAILRNRCGAFDNAQTNKMQKYGTNCLLDLKLQWSEKTWNAYLQANNLTSKHYHDISNVEQPGLWIMGGVKFNLPL